MNYLEYSMGTDLYFIALIPPEPLLEQVRMFKLVMKNRYGTKHALKSPAHITLQMPFRLQTEDGITASLRNFARKQEPFEVRLNGFDSFPPRVIFIKVSDPMPIAGLYNDLTTMLVENNYIKGGGHTRPFHPHMTIATRDMSEGDFQAAWPIFRERSFIGSFTASSLFLLKHNGATWDIHREFTFGK